LRGIVGGLLALQSPGGPRVPLPRYPQKTPPAGALADPRPTLSPRPPHRLGTSTGLTPSARNYGSLSSKPGSCFSPLFRYRGGTRRPSSMHGPCVHRRSATFGHGRGASPRGAGARGERHGAGARRAGHSPRMRRAHISRAFSGVVGALLVRAQGRGAHRDAN
jgi:hypothetical protein